MTQAVKGTRSSDLWTSGGFDPRQHQAYEFKRGFTVGCVFKIPNIDIYTGCQGLFDFSS